LAPSWIGMRKAHLIKLLRDGVAEEYSNDNNMPNARKRYGNEM
jgi:hypothetical protein